MDPNIAKATDAINEMGNDPEIREMVRLRELANINWRHSHACALEEGQRRTLLANIKQMANPFGLPLDPSHEAALDAKTNEGLERVFSHLLASRDWPNGL